MRNNCQKLIETLQKPSLDMADKRTLWHFCSLAHLREVLQSPLLEGWWGFLGLLLQLPSLMVSLTQWHRPFTLVWSTPTRCSTLAALPACSPFSCQYSLLGSLQTLTAATIKSKLLSQPDLWSSSGPSGLLPFFSPPAMWGTLDFP